MMSFLQVINPLSWLKWFQKEGEGKDERGPKKLGHRVTSSCKSCGSNKFSPHGRIINFFQDDHRCITCGTDHRWYDGVESLVPLEPRDEEPEDPESFLVCECCGESKNVILENRPTIGDAFRCTECLLTWTIDEF
jgi:hypothetical protein